MCDNSKISTARILPSIISRQTSSSSSIESLRCYAGSYDGRAHPDQGPLTGRSSPTAPASDQDAPSWFSRVMGFIDALEDSYFGDAIGFAAIVMLTIMGVLIMVGLLS